MDPSVDLDGGQLVHRRLEAPRSGEDVASGALFKPARLLRGLSDSWKRTPKKNSRQVRDV